MRLYILCDEDQIRDRWLNCFTAVNPTILENFSSFIESNSIVFAYDVSLKRLSDLETKILFLRRVMVLSSVPDFDDAQHFLHLGAMGYGNAMMHESHLHSAYQALEEGKVWLHPDFITMMISQIRTQKSTHDKSLAVLDVLSHREREVALMLGDGATHQEISDALDITVRTVKAHASAIYQKLSLKDRLALSLLLHS
ncbi:response regulator transcription factor [Sulfuricurvum sp.]|uniref:response regulator transcription factor n=1 Tax=Sulfuricurvum sp. TaxID=2025608 RepID=UPI002E31BF02|nr:LuxR C-terminal-related transcriptional regulator [Sulfuricurvum sp.]HEX5329752.1 LuxR C-terminal-related transcriptional regulator [Sulfuricurvum sp.]